MSKDNILYNNIENSIEIGVKIFYDKYSHM